VCSGLAHRTIRCVWCTRTVQSPNRHSWVSPGSLRYNSPDCTVCHQTVRCNSGATATSRNGRLQKRDDQMNSDEQYAQSQSRRSEAHRTLNNVCPVPLDDKASNAQKLQNPNGWVTWLAHWTVSGGAPHCPVRPSIAACSNGCLVVEGYKYPPTTTTSSIQDF
jgi:hypothetical protein